MMQPPPESLEYRTPASDAPARHRQKARRHALGNGVASVAIGLFFGACVASYFGPIVMRGPVTTLLLIKMATFSFYAMGYVVGGVLYIVASVMVKKCNHRWERTLILVCATPLGVVLVTLV